MRIVFIFTFVLCIIVSAYFIGRLHGKVSVYEKIQESYKVSTRPACDEEKWIETLRSKKIYKNVEPVFVDLNLRKFLFSRFDLYLDSQTTYTIVIEKVVMHRSYDGEENLTFAGHVLGIEGSAVTLTCNSIGVTGSVITPDERYQIRPGPQTKNGQRLHAIILLRD